MPTTSTGAWRRRRGRPTAWRRPSTRRSSARTRVRGVPMPSTASRLRKVASAAATLLFVTTATGSAQAPGAQSPSKVIHLFDGKDLSGWTADVPARDTDKNAPASFVVRKGLLVSMGKPEGHLVTDGAWRDYRLEVEYRFPGKG